MQTGSKGSQLCREGLALAAAEGLRLKLTKVCEASFAGQLKLLRNQKKRDEEL